MYDGPVIAIEATSEKQHQIIFALMIKLFKYLIEV